MFFLENGAKKDQDRRLQAISEAIRVVPHFPKQGIMFQDITTLLLDHNAFKDAVDIFVDRYRDMDISVVAGVEARGFIFGSSIALGIGAKFVPLCKPGKLPGEVISEKYVLEYGTDCLELHVGAVQSSERVIIIDDLVATGGTLSAAIRLLELAGAEVVECACVIGLSDLKVRSKLNGKATLYPFGATSSRKWFLKWKVKLHTTHEEMVAYNDPLEFGELYNGFVWRSHNVNTLNISNILTQ